MICNTVEDFKILFDKEFKLKYVQYFSEVRRFTHYYNLNYNRWIKVKSDQTDGKCYYINNDTADIISNLDLPKDVTIIHGDELFIIVRNFTDEESAIMDILE